MKKLYYTLKGNSLKGCYFFSRSNFAKAISFGTVMGTLLSSVSPIFAANVAIIGERWVFADGKWSVNISESGNDSGYEYGSHGSIVFNGHAYYCGVDYVAGRGSGSTENDLDRGKTGGGPIRQSAITAQEQYQRFLENRRFISYHPYGTMDKSDRQSSNGGTIFGAGHIGYATGGFSNVQPRAFGIYSFVTGCGAYASGNYSTASGAGATTKAGGAQAFGVSALASGKVSIAIGVGSEASKDSAVALGGIATASEENATALGVYSEALKKDSVAIGSHSVADVDAGVSGYDPVTGTEKKDDDHVWKSTLAAVSVGGVSKKYSRQITGVAAGSKDTDAVNVAQLKSLKSYMDAKNLVEMDDSGVIVIGNTKETDEIRIASKSGEARRLSGVADAQSDSDAVNKQQLGARIKSLDSSFNSRISELTTATEAAVYYDKSSEKGNAVNYNSITLGKGDSGAVALHNVQAGSLSENSTDAINGSQIYDLTEKFSQYLGGGSGYGEDGQWTAPTFHLKIVHAGGEAEDKTYKTVAEAFTGASSSAVNLYQDTKDGIGSFIQFDDGSAAIAIGDRKEGTEITIANKSGQDRRLSGVADATSDNDAINKKQLDDSAKNFNDGIHKLSQTVKSLPIQQDASGNSITIGVSQDGDEITIANKSGQARRLSGVADATSDNDAINKQQLDAGIKSLDSSFNSRISGLKTVTAAAVYYDKSSEKGNAVNYNSITLGKGNSGAVALHNVQAGSLSENSTDAINGSQLFTTNENVKSVTDQVKTLSDNASQFFGGGVNLLTGVAPTYEVNGITYNDFGSAFSGIDKSLTDVEKKLTGSINQNSILWSSSDEAFVARHGDEKSNSKITYLEAGSLSKTSTDAINGSQIYDLTEKFSQYLGGGSGYGEDGQWTAPTFHLKIVHAGGEAEDKTYKTVAEAFTGASSSAVNLYQDTKDGIGSFIQFDDGSAAIAIGDRKEGTEITIANKSGQDRRLSGVADATSDNDAINKKQLDDSAKNFNDGIHKLSQTVKSLPIQQDASGNSITIGVSQDGDEITIANKSGQARRLSGVADATSDNDAINKQQLDAGIKSLDSSFNSRISGLKTVTAAAVYYDKSSEKGDAVNYNSITLGKGNSGAVALHNVQAGSLSENSTDAINGSQLFTTNENVKSVTDQVKTLSDNASQFFGGGVNLLTGVAPTYEINGEKYNDFGSAFSGIDKSLTDVEKKLTGSINQNSILWSSSDEAFVARHGDEKSNSKITYLEAGSLSKTSTDAINGSQIYDLTEKFSQYLGGGSGYGEDSQWIAPTFHLKIVHAGGEAEDKTYKTVAEAFTGASSSAVNLYQDTKDGIGSFIQFDDGSAAIAIGDRKEGTEITIANKSGQDRRLSGVADATSDNDAINKKQLDDSAKNFNDGIHKLSQTVKSLPIQQDASGNSITIGVSQDGDEITIANKSGQARRLSGVADATSDNDAINKQQLDAGIKSLDSSFNSRISGLKTVTAAAVYYDKSSEKGNAVNYNSITLGKGNSGAVALHNVQAGSLSENSTDAINGSQLFTTNENVKSVTDQVKTLSDNASQFFGGGVNLLTGVAPTYEVNGITYNDFGSAFSGIDKSLTDVEKKLTGSINQNSILWSSSDEAFVARHGDEKSNSKITYLEAGSLSKTSTDAINGSQIYDLTEKFSQYLGGGSGYGEDGQWTAPTFHLKIVHAGGEAEDKTYKTVADAFTGASSSAVNLYQDTKDGIGSFIQFDDGSAAIAIGDRKEGTEITIANKSGQDRRLSGVADATSDNDAINKKQLDDSAKNFNDGIHKLSQTVKSLPIQQDASGNSITIGVSQDGDEITIANKSGQARRLSGVADATSDNDAINKQQLDAGIKSLDSSFNNRISGLTTATEAAVYYDKSSEKGNAVNYNSITLGKGNSGAVALHNVQAGSLSENSTDAINGSQLFTTNENVKSVTDQVKTLSDNASQFFGGGVNLLTGVAPTYEINGEKYNDFGSAFSGIDKSLTDVEKKLTGSINQNSILWSSSDEAFVARHGDEKSNSKITYLEAGSLSKTSTDAINGSQIYDLTEKFSQYLGGGSGYGEDGQWTAPTFHLKIVHAGGEAEDKTYKTVADAFTGASSSAVNLYQDTKDGIGSFIQFDDGSAAIAIGDRKEGTEITIANKSGQDRRLSGVADATSDNDAINKKQLDDSAKNFNDGIHKLSQTVKSLPIQQDASGNSITIGVSQDGDEITIANKSGQARRLSGVADATSDNDAINKQQLDAGIKSLDSSFNSRISGLKTVTAAAVYYDKSSEKGNAVNYNSITLGKGNSGAVALHNVQAGSLSENSTDAINGSQLFTTNENVKSVTDQVKTLSDNASQFFGGGVNLLTGVAPTYEINGEKYNDFGSAFSGIDKSLTDVEKKLTGSINQNSVLWSSSDEAFVARHGDEKSNSKITYLEAGSLSKTSTDAINGSQIYDLTEKFSQYLGGGSGYGEDGQWTAPTFHLKIVHAGGKAEDKTYKTVAEAFTGASSSAVNLYQDTKDGIGSFIQFDDGSAAIAIGDRKEGTEITIANKSGQDRRLSGVADATSDNDAINKKQLDDSAKNFNDGIHKLSQTVKSLPIQQDASGNSITIGVSQDGDEITIANKSGQARRLSGVADATSDNDAINKQQLDAGIKSLDSSFNNRISGLTTATEAAVYYDKSSEKGNAVNYNSITLGKGNSGAVALHNVQAGSLSENSTDAINGSQLFTTNENVKSVTDQVKTLSDNASQFFGGGVNLLTGVAPTYEINGEKYNDFGSAFSGIDKSLTDVEKKLTGSINQNSILWSSSDEAFVARHGDEKSNSKITYLEAGSLSKTSTDAINGSQIYDLTEKFSQYLGGGSGYGEDGQWTAPTFHLKIVHAGGEAEDKTYKTVADAFTGASSSAVNLYQDTKDGIGSFIQFDDGSAAIAIGDRKEGTEITIANKSGQDRRLSGVADATSDNDAINKKQLDDSAKNFNDGIHKLSQTVKSLPIQQDASGNSITIGVSQDGDEITIANKSGQARRLSGVADATSDNDAINKQQLDAGIKSLDSSFNSRISGLKTVTAAAVYYDKSSEKGNAVNYNSITLGKGNSGAVALHNVQAGSLSENSTDAINGSQLFTTNENVKSVTDQVKTLSDNASQFFGGGVNLLTGVAPTYEVNGITYNDFGSAFSGIDKSLTDVEKKLTGSINQNSVLWSSSDEAFVARHGDEKSNSKITYLEAGSLSKTSTDAINGSQIYDLTEKFSQYLGGGSGYGEDGQWTAPTFHLKIVHAGGKAEDKTYKTVAEAFTGASSSAVNLYQDTKDGIGSFIQFDDGSAAIAIGDRKEGTEITIANKSGQDRRLSGVADATSDNDAINKKQLDDSAKNFNDGIHKLSQTVKSLPIQQDASGNSITIGVSQDGDEITIANKSGQARRLSGVADATSDNDAINKQQLDAGIKSLDSSFNNRISGLTTATEAAVYYDKSSEKGNAVNYNSITLGKGNSGAVALHNVQAGSLSENSTDAINGSQLFTTNENVKSVTDQVKTLSDNASQFFGGGVNLLTGVAPTYEINGEKYNDFGSAFSGIDKSLTDVEKKLTGSINQNSILWSSSDEAFVARHGDEKSNSKITYLEAGSLSKTSTDAINGSQIYDLTEKFSQYLGGGSGYGEDGQWTAPTFHLKIVHAGGEAEDKTYKTVADAFTGASSSAVNLYQDTKDGIGSFIQFDDGSAAIAIGDRKEGTEITIANKSGQDRRLSGVADATSDNDAINKKQLDDSAKNFNDGIHKLSQTVKSLPIQQDASGNSITIGVSQDGDEITIANKSGQARRLSGVADATSDNDAINKQQLDAGIKSLDSSFNSRISGLKTVTAAAVYYDKSSEKGNAVNYNSITLGKGNSGAVALHNVQAGSLSENSTDAINGSQLFTTNENVKSVTDQVKTLSDNASQFFGGGVNLLTGVAPTYEVNGITYNDFGSAFSGIDKSLTDVEKKLTGSINQNSILWSSSDEAFVARHGDEKSNSKITYLEAGSLSKTSTDAINGSQIYDLTEKFSQYLGGGSGYGEDGQWTAPTFHLKIVHAGGEAEDKTYKTVAEAFTGASSSAVNLYQDTKDGIGSFIQFDDGSAAIAIGDRKEGTEITIANKSGQDRRLSGVADATSDNDAINKKQLDDSAKNFNDGIHKLSQTVKSLPIQQDASGNSITIGVSQDGDEITIANKSGQARRLSGVADATSDNDAINKQQLDAGIKSLDSSFNSRISGLKTVTAAAVYYDKSSEKGDAVNYNSITLGKGNSGAVALHNVQAGSLSENSTDAINGSQLFTTNENVKSVTDQVKTLSDNASQFFGGGVNLLTGVAPTYEINGEKYNDFGSAFSGIDKSLTDVEKKLTGSINQNSILWSSSDEAFVARHGDEKSNSKITYLEAGSLSKTSTDAINGSQIYDLTEKFSQYLGGGSGYGEDSQWIAPTFHLKIVHAGGEAEDKTYKTVAEAFTGASSSAVNLYQDTKDGIGSFIQFDDGSAAIAIGDRKEGTEITIANKSGQDRRLSGVADATSDNDAINKKQLDDSAKNFNDGIHKLSQTVKSLPIQQDASGNSITIGVSQDGDEITIANKSGQARRLSGVADATSDNDAINKQQLDAGIKSLDSSFNNRISGLTTATEAAVYYDKSSEKGNAVNYNSITLGKGNSGAVALHNVQAGSLSENSTDAINGSQLFTTNENVKSVTDQVKTLSDNASQFFGGGVNLLTGVAPTYEVNGITYNDFGSAFSGIDKSLTDVEKKLTGSINQNSILWSSSDEAFVARHGDEKSNSKITYLEAGSLSKTSTDAINGSQIYDLTEKFSQYLGGGSGYGEDGQWTAPTFHLKIVHAGGEAEDKTYKTVADAFTGASSSAVNLYQDTKDGIGSFIQFDDGSAAIAIGDRKEGTEITIANKSGQDRRLSGVADATSDNDAINKKQLDDSAKNFNDGIHKLSQTVKSLPIQQDASGNSITIGVSQDGDEITIANKSGQARRLSGVADATSDNDAINKQQLDAGIKSLDSSFNSRISGLKTVTAAAVYYDKSSEKGNAVNYNSITLGKGNSGAVALHNVQAGSLSENSTDAINGSQLFTTNENVKSVTDQVKTLSDNASQFFGGGVNLLTGVAPTYEVNGITYNDFGSAFSGIDKSLTDVEKKLTGSINQNSILWSSSDEAFVARHGDEKSNSKITYLEAGSLSKISTDAINGSQIYDLTEKFSQYLGGGSGYGEDSQWIAPTFHLKIVHAGGEAEDKTYKTVADAFTGASSSAVNLYQDTKDGIGSFIQFDDGSAAIAIGDRKEGTEITIANKSGQDRRLSGVADATSDNDAINKKQLDDSAKNFNDGIHKLSQTVKSLPIQQDASGNSITIGVSQDGDEITIANKSGQARRLSGVADATSDNDAVNKKQLDDQIKSLNSSVSGNIDELKTVTAAAVYYDKSSEKGDVVNYNSITLGKKDSGPVALHNVKAGDISENSTDAVNGSQLFATNENVKAVTDDVSSLSGNISKFFGGGADLLTGVLPTYEINGEKYNDLGSAFSGIDKSLTDVKKKLTGSINQNSILWSSSDEAFVARHGDEKSNSKITYLEAGSLSKISTDAINGSQIYDLTEKFSQYLGGGSGYGEDSQWIAPTFHLKIVNADGKTEDKNYKTVAEAFTGMNSSISSLYQEITGGIDILVKQVQDIENSVKHEVVNYDKDEHGNKINSIALVGGNESEPVLIDNVSDGQIASGSKEAVNGGQLYDYTKQQMDFVLQDAQKYTDTQVKNSVNEVKSYADMKFEEFSYSIEDSKREARQAAAISLAVSNLRYYDEPGSLSLSVGGGLWRGQYAFALGAGYTSEDGNLRSNLSITSAGRHLGVGAGITLRLK
ncbi:YadA-like family protein [Bartonella sp. B10]